MGEVSFDSTASPVEGVSREMLNEEIEIYESKYRQN